MRYYLARYYLALSFYLFSCVFLYAQVDQLSNWPAYEIEVANTAVNEEYLTLEEKKVFLLLNLARINPQLFYKNILSSYQVPNGYSDDCLTNNRYIKSLKKELQSMSRLNPLYPDTILWEHAKCHAIKSGKRGIVGHKRIGCSKPDFYSECCSYGFEKAIDIVVQLLIDYQVKDLGHRKIMLSDKQQFLGVSIQPHKGYGSNAVLDFSYTY